MIELIPATQKHVELFYEGLPPYSMRGIVALEDGKPIGIGGTFNLAGRTYMFSEMREEAFKHKKYILKAARLVLDQARDKIVYAQAEQWSTAPRFLKHLGFELIDSGNRLYRRVP